MSLEQIHQTLDAIGYPENPQDWKTAPALLENGKLTILGHPVMEDWEAPYMEMLAGIATRNGGVILEVGFGLGLSATRVQSYPIEKHVIIEGNGDMFKRLQDFAGRAPHPVEPLFGLWQEVAPTLPAEFFDGILFDTYPLSADELRNQLFFFEHAYRILKKGGIFTYYSEEAVDYSPGHLELLHQAGFSNINRQVCPVNPPDDCKYWKEKSFLAPIVIK